MDGSLFGASAGPRASPGILYADDFDAPELPPPPAPAAPPPPSYSEQDIAAARQDGYEQGLQEARSEREAADAALLQSTLQTIADALAGARKAAAEAAERLAGETAAALLALLQAALPALMQRHAGGEVAAFAARVLPALRREPQLRLLVSEAQHGELAPLLAGAAGAAGGMAQIIGSPALAPGDLRIEWADGSASRSVADLWTSLCAALTCADLPSIEEITRGQRA
jgi:flagellar assembly protein FliH